jgi:hypothetical protein
MDVLPLHLQCLRACHDFVRRVAHSTPLMPHSSLAELTQEEDLFRSSSTSPAACMGSTNVLESVFQRMDSAAPTSDVNQRNQRADCDFLRQHKENMVSLWLQSMYRHVCNDKKSSSRRTDVATEQKAKPERVDVPTAVATHLMVLLLSPRPSSKQSKTRTTTVSMRRAATYMIHLLLQKSSAARNHFCSSLSDRSDADATSLYQHGGSNSHAHAPQLWLVAWMDQLQPPPAYRHEVSTESSPPQHCLLLHESYRLLQYIHQSFGHCYPTLNVAMQRFQGQNPNLETNTFYKTSAMALSQPLTPTELRRLRDTAIQCIEVEEQKVQKLLQKAYQCIDVMVPRLVIENKDVAMANSDIIKSVHNDVPHDPPFEKDDDENIDWEDGVEDVYSNMASHLLAVEHTMAAMKSIGGQILLQDDELAVDFTCDDTVQHLDSDTKVKLRAIVDLLQRKHVPRLSAWETGVSQADDLIAKMTEPEMLPKKKEMVDRGTSLVTSTITSSTSVPMVRLTTRQVQQRNDTMSRIAALQKQVAAVIASALRLGMDQVTPSEDCV